MSVQIIENDILSANHNEIIVHQTNCLTTNSKGLAKHIFDLYPHSNVYSSGCERIPGKIIVMCNEKNPTIVNLFGQHKPGKFNNYETKVNREEWFNQGLAELLIYLNENNLNNKVIFPYKIGCGLAGGNWDNYYKMICDFNEVYSGEVVIYKIE